jgi:PAS domain S-box-containing protein
VRLRWIAPVLFVIALIAGAFAVTRIESLHDGVLVLAGGLALAAVTGALAVTTERRRRAMREVERYFALSPEMVILAGFDGYWKRVNPAVEAILGYTEREALARPFMEFVHSDDHERTEEEARRVAGGAKALAFENRILCKDGSYKLIEWTVTPVPEEGVMYGVGRDITERRRSQREEIALRRLATLVAQGLPPSEIFSAVSEEVGRLFGSDLTVVAKFDPDGPATVVMGLARDLAEIPVGSRWELEDGLAAARVYRTGHSARIDAVDRSALRTPIGEVGRRLGVVSTVSCPIHVEGRLWGAITVPAAEPLPPDTEERLEKFTQVVAAAIANADSREALARLADEQAALRRVATLVAQDVPASELFGAVAREVGALFGTDFSGMGRFEGDDFIVVASTDDGWLPNGTRWDIDDALASAEVHRTGRSARMEGVDWSAIGGTIGAARRRLGVASTVASPITVSGEPWGALSLSSTREPLPIDTEERLEKFADIVATAIANAESREALARLANEQTALRRVATLVARDAPSDEVFESVATEVGKLFDTDITIVGRYDDDGMATSIGNWSASPGGVPVGTRSAIGGRNVLTMVAETGKPARIDGYDDSSGDAAEIARRHGWRSSIAAPIVVEGRLWGVMLVATQRPDPFPLGAEERLAAFTDLVATALANAQAHDEVLRFGDEQAALGRVATLVAAGVAPERVFTAVVEEASSLVDLERIELVRYEGDAKGTVIAASGDHPFPTGSTWSLDDASVMATVARTGHAARIDDYSNLGGEIARTARRAGFRSAIGAPITIEGRLWGVIIAISTDAEPIPERSEARLTQFTELVATAVGNAEARHALERVAAEQATLRRIATLVAEGRQPEEIFAVVIEEVGHLFGTDLTTVGRFDDDQPAFVAVALGKGMQGVDAGTSWALDDPLTATRVFQSGRSVRVNERLRERSPALVDMLARLGVVSTVTGPIMVEGRLWGAVMVSSIEELPADAEERLDKFTELVATAIANAESKSELSASRRRIVAASDETRRRIERDLHDGTQQRLVSLGLAVRAAEADLPAERADLRAQLSGVAEGLVAAVEDLQEISRGIHPAILSKGGLGPAFQALAHRSAIPVDLDIGADVRLAEPIEVAAYFVASEALANAAKYSEASRIDVSLGQRDGRLVLSVGDDGVGGADASRGSGLVGLADRVEALGGSIRVSSRPGEGTQITAELPLELELPQAAG